ncbi:hypothetical protein FACS1894216_08450 [Synergistales bacterium]|nr:hypothetical protein FACS1894216_08450 [Synergistales bacterium]
MKKLSLKIQRDVMSYALRAVRIGSEMNDRRGHVFAFAESCTGGLVASSVTSIPGAADVFCGSAVTYSNEAKMDILGISENTLRNFGAVSGECAAEMARGALRLFGSRAAVSITGIAGPGGGSDEKPVGTVWFASAVLDGKARAVKSLFSGQPRNTVRLLAARRALLLLLKELENIR